MPMPTNTGVKKLISAFPAGGIDLSKLISVKRLLDALFAKDAAANPALRRPAQLVDMIGVMREFIGKLGGPAALMQAHKNRVQGVIPAKEDLSNIAGVFIGRKYTAQGVTPELAIRFHVCKKVAPSDISSSAVIPPSIKINGLTIATDVVETGPILALAGTPQAPANGGKKDPRIPAGSSISSDVNGETGTLGALCVADETDDGQFVLCVLSNNHVSASSNLGKSMVAPTNAGEDTANLVYHPGRADAPASDSNPIGILYRFLELNFDGENEVDASLTFAQQAWVSATHADSNGNTFTIDPNPLDYAQGMNVMKIGRTTGFTKGIVDGIAGEFPTSYDLGGGNTRQAYFVNQIAVYQQGQPFSLAGDSGSLIVDADTQRPIGLLFSGNDQADGQGRFFSYANPIASVMEKLNISRFLPHPDYFDK